MCYEALRFIRGFYDLFLFIFSTLFLSGRQCSLILSGLGRHCVSPPRGLLLGSSPIGAIRRQDSRMTAQPSPIPNSKFAPSRASNPGPFQLGPTELRGHLARLVPTSFQSSGYGISPPQALEGRLWRFFLSPGRSLKSLKEPCFCRWTRRRGGDRCDNELLYSP